MEIKFSPDAQADILGIYNYIKRDGVAIAEKQISYIYDAIELLGQFPDMGVSLQKYATRTTTLRFLSVKKLYIVIYEITDQIEIYKVYRKGQDFIADLGL